MPTIETREVLAWAYLRTRKKWQRLLTHAVLMEDGRAVRVLCRRVRLDSIAGSNAGNDVNAEPTCTTCRRRKGRMECRQ